MCILNLFSSVTDNVSLTTIDKQILTQILEDEKSMKRRFEEINITKEQLQNEIDNLSFKKARLNLERHAIENRITFRKH